MPTPERDGCACPPWVVRCAHWDGRVLVLAPLTMHPGHQVLSPWAVWSGTEWFKHGLGCTECIGLFGEGATSQWASLPAAEAEFSRREAELLRREDA